ncbi:hypothetical protein J1N35_034481 [Gossypium stocksii]|uniref:Uncharacterized protein n=1 Tax=Gossypium stocksii TaxID=47602 RepID=A0A9D3US35_9ROSI|nr:hypothetical protein J1N35_034481 [Gossypium stocksii]
MVSGSKGTKRLRTTFVLSFSDGWVYLSTNGLVKYEDMFMAVGGLLKDQKEYWIVGFASYENSFAVKASESLKSSSYSKSREWNGRYDSQAYER